MARLGHSNKSEEFLRALASEGRLPLIRSTPGPPHLKPVVPIPVVSSCTLKQGEIGLGADLVAEKILGLDVGHLIGGRLLIQGASGAGKSWTLRRLLEQTGGTVQQIIIDPEGDFRTLTERFSHAVIDGAQLDVASVAIAARRVREHRLSVILDLSDLEREGQLQMTAAFLTALIAAPQEFWTPAIVAIDEAHLFAPFGGQGVESSVLRKASIAAVTDLMSRGRKRGLGGVLATQRLARLAKSVASEVHNFLIGLNTLDLDIRRAAETIGWDAKRAFDRLPTLQAGEFVAVGPAFSSSPATVKVGSIETTHRGGTPTLKPCDRPDSTQSAVLLDLDGLVAEAEQMREMQAAPVGLRAVTAFIRDPAFPLAGEIVKALRPLSPNGVRLDELQAHLNAEPDQFVAAISLLDRFGALEMTGDATERAVRLGRNAL